MFGGNPCIGLGCGTPKNIKIEKSSKVLPCQQLLVDTPQKLATSKSSGVNISRNFGENLRISLDCGTPQTLRPQNLKSVHIYPLKPNQLYILLG